MEGKRFYSGDFTISILVNLKNDMFPIDRVVGTHSIEKGWQPNKINTGLNFSANIYV